MLTAIVSLSIVVVLVIALHIYARYVLRRQARRRAAIRQLGLMVSSVEPPKTGLDPAIINSLPVFSFKRTENGDEREGEHAECAVCLSLLEDGEMARILPNCKHTFHRECIDKWLGAQSTCPICRTEAEPRVARVVLELLHGAPFTAPPVASAPEGENSTLGSVEGTSSDGGIPQITQSSAKVNGSSSRLSSFRRILSRERSSSPRVQSSGPEEDVERQ